VTHSTRICRLALSLSALLCTFGAALEKPPFTSPLPTGVRLDPAGEGVDLGSMPINLVLAPEGHKAVVVLSGWREQGLQVVDLTTRKVAQTLLQDGAFYGAAFSPDGHRLYVSGGNTDLVFVYAWKDGAATLENKFALSKARTAEGMGTSYPAGITAAPNGKFIYVAENVGDWLAMVNTTTGEITQRFATDHYPYDVVLTASGQVFVSAWGGSTVSQFRVLAHGTLAYFGRIEVGRHPSAMAVNGSLLYVTLAGTDRVAVVDTKLRKVARYLYDAAPGAARRQLA
jgi:DNA-binding beta-propeller fold protein YncE